MERCAPLPAQRVCQWHSSTRPVFFMGITAYLQRITRHTAPVIRTLFSHDTHTQAHPRKRDRQIDKQRKPVIRNQNSLNVTYIIWSAVSVHCTQTVVCTELSVSDVCVWGPCYGSDRRPGGPLPLPPQPSGAAGRLRPQRRPQLHPHGPQGKPEAYSLPGVERDEGNRHDRLPFCNF